MKIQEIIDTYENNNYGVVFVDTIDEKMVPYDMFTEEQMKKITALYLVKMTQEIFENGLESLDGVEYTRLEVQHEA